MSVMEKHFQIELNEDRQAFLRSMGQNVMLNGKEVESAIELPDVAKISIESSEFIFIKQIARPKKRTSPVEEATIFINGQCDPEDIYEKFINLPIGRGVFARTDLGRGRFLVQYDGKLLLAEDVANPETNYTYFFSHQGKKYCIDATHEPEYGPSLGRLVNHADTNSERNAKMKVVVVNDLPCLALFSTSEITITPPTSVATGWEHSEHEAEHESEDELAEIDNDDSDADPDFNPAMVDGDDNKRSATSNSAEEEDFDSDSIVADKPSEEVVISGSESDNAEIEESVIYPQLCSDKLLITQPSEKNSKGNLNNKKHACFFCKNLFPNIARHLKNRHSEKHEVAKILLLPLRSKQRRKAWEELVNKGDFSHNFEAIDKGHGTVIPKYRSKNGNENVRSLIPCHSCRGFYKKKDLWKHQKRCSSQKSTILPSKPVQAGKLLLPHKHTTEKFHENVLVNMKDDEIKRAVESDSAILRYGNSKFEDKGHEVQNHTYTSCKMKELGRLLLTAKTSAL